MSQQDLASEPANRARTPHGLSSTKHRCSSRRISCRSCSSNVHTRCRFHGRAASAISESPSSPPCAARRSSSFASHSCSNSISSASSGPCMVGVGAAFSAAAAAIDDLRPCALFGLAADAGSKGDAGEMGEGFWEDVAAEEAAAAGIEEDKGREKMVEGTGRTQMRSLRRLCCSIRTVSR